MEYPEEDPTLAEAVQRALDKGVDPLDLFILTGKPMGAIAGIPVRVSPLVPPDQAYLVNGLEWDKRVTIKGISP